MQLRVTMLSVIYTLAILVLFVARSNAYAAAWNDESTCSSLSVLQNLTDAAFSSSGDWQPDRDPSQVRYDRKGWCPGEQIDALLHVYLEVTFDTLVNLMAIEMGGSDDSADSDVVENFMLDYQRGEGSSDWLRYTRGNSELLKGGRTSLEFLKPSILARRLRFIPVSKNPVDVCVNLELYGCAYPEGIISYEMPVPDKPFEDTIYDGSSRSTGMLRNGVGFLTDGLTGNSSGFDVEDAASSITVNWVGWSSVQLQSRTVEISFKFDSYRQFFNCRIYMITLFELSMFATPFVVFNFVQQDGKLEKETIYTSRNLNMNGDRWYDYQFPRPRIAREVRISLSFGPASDSWLVLSEIKFHSVLVEPSQMSPTVASTTSSSRRTTRRTTASPTGLDATNLIPVDARPTNELALNTTRVMVTRKTVTRRAKSTTSLALVLTTQRLLLEDTGLSSVSNSTLPMKQAVTTQSSYLLPIVIGIVLGVSLVCLAVITVLTRKYCCNAKHYRYWAASQQSHAGAKNKAKTRCESADKGGNANVALVHSAPPTIITNPLNSSASADKFTLDLDDAQRLMLMQNVTSTQTAAPLFNLSLAHSSTPKGVVQTRLDSSDYVSMPDENRSVTTRTNSVVAVPMNMSQNASLVSGDLSSASFRPTSFATGQPQSFGTINVNGMMLLVPNNVGNDPAPASSPTQSLFIAPPRPHLLVSLNPDTTSFRLPHAQVHTAHSPFSMPYSTDSGLPIGNSRYPGDQYATLTMNRATRKRRHQQQQHAHRRSSDRNHLAGCAVRSTCSSLSNQSATTPTNPNFSCTIRPTDLVPHLFGNSSQSNERLHLQSAFGSSRMKRLHDFAFDEPNDIEGESNNVSSLPRVRPESLKLLDKLGQGVFGEIHVCEMRFGETDLDSAVCNSSTSTSNNASGESGHSSLSHADCAGETARLCVAKLLRCALNRPRASTVPQHSAEAAELNREISLLSRLNDPNVAKVTHIVADGDCRLGVVLEFTSKTSLVSLSHSLSNRSAYTQRSHLPFTVYAAMQIASGMKHLESLNIAHCDLAARNCFMADQFTIKICDVAMAMSTYDSHYYTLDNGESRALRLPIRWMSWEALLRGRFSSQSDVWAFAVTLWELLTQCLQMPYSDMNNEQVLENLSSMRFWLDAGERSICRTSMCSEEARSADELVRHARLPSPPCCPRELYDLMCECWNRDESRRPSFREIHLFLQRKCIGYDPKDDAYVAEDCGQRAS